MVTAVVHSSAVAVARSSASAIEDLYRADGDRLWRSVCAFAGDPDVASDAVAEAFAQALRRGEQIRDARAWVWRTAFKLAAGDLKRRRTLVHGELPESAYREAELDGELMVALQQLTDGQRAAIVLHYYADLPVAEISRRTGIKQIAVRAHLSRGRKRLRRVLERSR